MVGSFLIFACHLSSATAQRNVYYYEVPLENKKIAFLSAIWLCQGLLWPWIIYQIKKLVAQNDAIANQQATASLISNYSKVSYFKWLGLLTLTKFWIHLLVNSSTSSFKNINSLTSKISISQYSICTYSILLCVHLHFNIFIALFSNYSFSTSLQQAFLQSCSDLFLSFSFHYSLNKVP